MPTIPLCLPLKSTHLTFMLNPKLLNRGVNALRVITVNLSWGYFEATEATTGTSNATSPNDDSLIISTFAILIFYFFLYRTGLRFGSLYI